MDAHGSEALTMRRLAHELGMGTMALYRYFPSKNDLMDAAIEIAAPEIELPPPGAAPWKQQLATLARALFHAGLRHPSVARERFERPLQTPAAMRVTDRAIALLLEAGLSKRDAVAAFKALLITRSRPRRSWPQNPARRSAGGPLHATRACRPTSCPRWRLSQTSSPLR
jgi:AcrR family transcriptional regulator